MEHTPWNSYYTDADVDPAATADEDLTDAFQTNPRAALRIENNKKNTGGENSLRGWKKVLHIHDLV